MKCDICGKKCKNASSLRLHKLRSQDEAHIKARNEVTEAQELSTETIGFEIENHEESTSNDAVETIDEVTVEDDFIDTTESNIDVQSETFEVKEEVIIEDDCEIEQEDSVIEEQTIEEVVEIANNITEMEVKTPSPKKPKDVQRRWRIDGILSPTAYRIQQQ